MPLVGIYEQTPNRRREAVMVTDFQKRLREIREAKDRESAERRAEEDAKARDRFREIESRFDRRERLEGIIEEYARNFVGEVPSFSVRKSFFEGKYRIEVSGEDFVVDEAGTPRKQFSRIAFFLDPRPQAAAEGSLEVQCKKTVRSRDLESASVTVPPDDEGLEAFERFVEGQFFEFANAYFGAGSPSAS